MPGGEWYFCLLHRSVEPYEACKAENRLGPYSTRDEAEIALEQVARRNKQWEDEDRRYAGEAAEPEDWDGSGPLPQSLR